MNRSSTDPVDIREGQESSARSWTAAALPPSRGAIAPLRRDGVCRFQSPRQKRRRAGALQDAGATQRAPCGLWSKRPELSINLKTD